MELETGGPSRASRIMVGAALGLLVLLPGLLLAFLSAGAGHGDYAAARALFPFSMLLTLLEGSIGPIAMAVGVVQFPLYGAVIASREQGSRMQAAMVIGALHLVAIFACFSGLLPNFS